MKLHFIQDGELVLREPTEEECKVGLALGKLCGGKEGADALAKAATYRDSQK